MLAFTSAPTHGSLPLASAQTFSAAPDRKPLKVAGQATVKIVRAVEWRVSQKNAGRSVVVGGMHLIPRLRHPKPSASHVEPTGAQSTWIVDLP